MVSSKKYRRIPPEGSCCNRSDWSSLAGHRLIVNSRPVVFAFAAAFEAQALSFSTSLLAGRPYFDLRAVLPVGSKGKQTTYFVRLSCIERAVRSDSLACAIRLS